MARARDSEKSTELVDQVRHAIEHKWGLKIVAGGSKSFYGCPVSGHDIDLSEHQGIIDYQPTELMMRVRAGTRLSDVEHALDEQGQMLAFEPPQFSPSSTIGGVIAAGLSGPRRPYAGSARDHLLGVQIINGLGQQLVFGGQVMKNVAGYDLSRLMVGAQGTLGIILDVSLKVVPKPAFEQTQEFSLSLPEAITQLRKWAQQESPISASCHVNGRLYLRYSGTEAGVKQAIKQHGGDRYDQHQQFWTSIRNQTHDFFTGGSQLWRLSVIPNTTDQLIKDDQLVEWGGGLRWVRADEGDWFSTASAHGGYATLFRCNDQPAKYNRFAPLEPAVQRYHVRLRQSLDPHGLFNHGCLGSE